MSVPLGGAYPSTNITVGTNLQFGNVSTTNASITTATIGELRTNILSQNTLNVSTINASALNLPADYVIPVLNVSTLNSQKENFTNMSAVNISVSNISAEFVSADNLQNKLEAGDNISIVGNTISAVSTFPASPTFTNVKSSVVNTSTLNASNISTGSLQFGGNLTYSGGLLNVNSTNSITSGSSDLVTSGAVFSALGGATTTDNARSLTNTKLYLGGDVTKPLIPFTTNQVDQNVSAGTTITIMSVNYTTKFGPSAVFNVIANFNYEVAGNGGDKITARLKYGTNVIFQQEQIWVDNGGGGTRSGDLAPLIGTRTSTVEAGTNVTFSVQIVNGTGEGSDDTFHFLTPDNCTFHITETLDNESSTSLSLGVGNVQANDADFNTLNVQAGSGNGTAIIGRTQLGNLGFSNMASLSINGNTGQTNYGFAQVANNQTIMNAQSATTYNSFRIMNEEVASINNIGLAIGKAQGSTAIFPLEVEGSAFIHDDLFVDEISATKVASNNISVENVSGVSMTINDLTILGTLNANLNFSTANLIAGDNILINSSGVISAYVSSSTQTHLNSLQVDNDTEINGQLIVDEASYFRDNLTVENNLFSGVAGSMEGSVILYSNDIGNNFTTKINSSTKEVNISATGTIEHLNYFIGDVKALTLTKDVGINMDKLTINDTGNNNSTTISRLNNATSINTHNGRILIFTDDSLTPAMTLYQNRIVETERLQNETLMETRNFSVDENVSVAGTLSSNIINVSQLNVSELNGGGLATANMSFDENDFVFEENTLQLGDALNISSLTLDQSFATGDALVVLGNSKVTDLNVSRNFFCEGADAFFGTPGGATPYFAIEGTPPRHKINFYSAGLSAPFEIGLRFGLNSSNQCQLELPRFGNVSLFNINISNTSTLDMDNVSTTIHNILNVSNISGSVGDFSTLNASTIPGFQRQLTAGANITISNNVISADDASLPADVNFSSVTSTTGNFSTLSVSSINGNNLSTASISFNATDFDFTSNQLNLAVPVSQIETDVIDLIESSGLDMSGDFNASTANISSLTLDQSFATGDALIVTGNTKVTDLNVSRNFFCEGADAFFGTPGGATPYFAIEGTPPRHKINFYSAGLSAPFEIGLRFGLNSSNQCQLELPRFGNVSLFNINISNTSTLDMDNVSTTIHNILNVTNLNGSVGDFTTINASNLSTGSIKFSSDFTFDDFSKTLNLAQTPQEAIAEIQENGLDTSTINTSGLNVDGLASFDDVGISGTLQVPTASITTLNCSTANTSNINSSNGKIRILNSSTINASSINVASYGDIYADFINVSRVSVDVKLTATSLEVLNAIDVEAVDTNRIGTINMSATNIVQAKTSNAKNGNFSTINASTINGYQRQLTAGANITISNNVISADDATLPADANFSSVTTDLLNVSTINVSSINGNNLSTASISFNATDFDFTSNQLNLAVPVSQIETDVIDLIESSGLDMTGNLIVDLLNGTTANISTLNASTITASGIVTTGNELRIGLNDNSTTPKTIAFGGMLNDNSYDHSIITTRIYDFDTERSELLLFKGSDVGGTNGPDRIRLRSANIVFDTYDSNTLSETFEQPRMLINTSGNVFIGGELNVSTINASNITGYQQTLIAGDNISIVDNTISSLGGELPADANFSTINASVVNGDNLSTATMIMSSDMLLDGFSNVLSISQTAKNEIRDSVINALSFQDLDTQEITADRIEVSFFGFTTLITAVEVKTTDGNFSNVNASNIPGYQKTLTAGTGIDITNNVISATGGGGALPSDANFSSVTATTGNFSTINSSNLSTGSIRFSDDFNFDTFSNTLNLAQSAEQAIANIEDNGLETTSVNTSSLNVDGLTSLDAVTASVQLSTPLGIMTTLNVSTINASTANLSVITGDSLDMVDIGCDNISADNASFINISATSITAPNVQPTLTAGTNIDITNNVISATQYVLPSSVNFSNVSTINLSATNISATSITAPNVQPTLTAGTNIDITGDTISTSLTPSFTTTNSSSVNCSTITCGNLIPTQINGLQAIGCIAMARVNFDGTADRAINCTSTLTNTGRYTITFNQARPDNLYVVQLTVFESVTGRDDMIITIDDDFSQTTTSFRYSIREEDNGTNPGALRNRRHYVAVFDQL